MSLRRRWTYQFKMRPGTIDTPGRAAAARYLEKSNGGRLDPPRRFWSEKAATRCGHDVLVGLSLPEITSKARDEWFWTHLDAEAVRL